MRPRKRILAPLGGDEFTVVLSHLADPETGIRIAERIVADMKTPFGLSMYRAKEAGRSTYRLYRPGMA